MKDELYKKENNLFQSLNWLAFQEEFGRETTHLGESSGIVFGLPFGRKFIWVQKGPQSVAKLELRIPDLPKGTIFLRLEPEQVAESEAKKLKLRPVNKGSLLSGQASPKATRVLDISGTEEEIMSQMKSKTRYNIRLAAKKGVVVKMLDSEDILYDLLQKTAQREKGYAPHEKSYYTKMIKDLAKNDLAHIFIAEYKGEFLAAILVSFFGEVATYLHGGFNDSHRNLMAPYLCQWEAIKYAKGRGCQYYDFWGVAETDDPSDSWAGISRFKEGFGGEKVVFPGGYDLIISPLWYGIFSLMAKVKHLIRK